MHNTDAKIIKIAHNGKSCPMVILTHSRSQTFVLVQGEIRNSSNELEETSKL